MKVLIYVFAVSIAFGLISCSTADPKAEIKQLVEAGDINGAVTKYKEVLDSEENPALEREFLTFLIDNNRFRDFGTRSAAHVRKYPEDNEVKQMIYDYHARLASDAERSENYGRAIDYIVQSLINPEYRDSKRWEARQITIFRKWYEQAREKDDLNMRRDLLNQMHELGLSNLARDLDPELFQELDLVDQGDDADAEAPTESDQ